MGNTLKYNASILRKKMVIYDYNKPFETLNESLNEDIGEDEGKNWK